MAAFTKDPVQKNRESRGTVLTVATDDYLDKWRFCINSQKDYCDLRGYDYVVHSRSPPGLHPKWAKIQYAIDALGKGAPVMLIDADAEISVNTPAFESLLAERPDSDILFAHGVSGRLNSGMMVFRPGVSSLATKFLQMCLRHRNMPVAPENFVTAEGENGRLIELIGAEPFASRAGVIECSWNCTSPDCYAKAHIRHYTGPLRQAAEKGELKPPPRGYKHRRLGWRARLRGLLGR